MRPFPPEEWEVAVFCERFHALPLPGGVLEQPPALMQIMTELIGYAEDYARYQAEGDKAPSRVRLRVMKVAARAVRDS